MSWLSGLTLLSTTVGNSIKSFLYLDANPVVTSCGTSSKFLQAERMEGGGGHETEPSVFPSASP